MVNTATLAELASLAGDPARAAILTALMDGRALTATELSKAAGVTAQTASGHLSRLTRAGMLAMEKQCRHRYHRLASAAVAHMIESIMQLDAIAATTPAISVGPRDSALRTARICYDHVAGRLGVGLTDALAARGDIELTSKGGLVSEAGVARLQRDGIDMDVVLSAVRRSGRVLCRPCLDWSERRHHLAGALGAALCRHFLTRNWLRRVEGTRVLSITPSGARGFRDSFGLTLD